MRKIAILTLALASLFTTVMWQKAGQPAIAAVISFSDIQGHWAEQSIKQAVAKGYVNGYPNGTFGPNNTVTRAEFVKMIVAALGIKVSESADEVWYKPYVDAVTAEGIYVNGDFASNDFNKAMPRLEMSIIAVRALGEKNVQTKEWMYRATKSGLIHGTAPGVLSPDGTTTRAQAITVIERILFIKDGEKIPVDKYAVSEAEMYWHNTNLFTVAGNLFDRPENYKSGISRAGINSWDESKLTLVTDDGKFKAELVKLVVIDMADPKDPNRKLLPPIKELSWVSAATNEELKKISDSYIFLFSTKLIHNKDANMYGDDLQVNFGGFDDDKKTLQSPKRLKQGDTLLPAYIVSKSNYKVDSTHSIRIYIEAPGSPGVKFKSQLIVRSYVNE